MAGFAGEMFDATILDFDPGNYDRAAQTFVPYAQKMLAAMSY